MRKRKDNTTRNFIITWTLIIIGLLVLIVVMTHLPQLGIDLSWIKETRDILK